MDLKTALECECCSARVDVLHDIVIASDELVAKALMLDEVAQIARLEQRMRELLLGKWRARSREAALAASARVAGGGSAADVHRIVDKAMNKWAPETEPRFSADASKVYRLARKAGAKKASGKTSASLSYQTPNFSQELPAAITKAKRRENNPKLENSFALLDTAAIADLEQESAIWIGSHYEKNVRSLVRSSVTPSTLKGLSERKAGEAVKTAISESLKHVSTPGGFRGTDIQYFEGLAANTVTNARVRGQVRSFQEYEVTRLVIVNPNDSRTSLICQHMSGKEFYVSQAVEQMDSLIGVYNPKDVKRLHPWMSFKEMLAVSPKAGLVNDRDARALAASGICLPPYHFRCRTTVDISSA